MSLTLIRRLWNEWWDSSHARPGLTGGLARLESTRVMTDSPGMWGCLCDVFDIF